jgi:hypothetical protein
MFYESRKKKEREKERLALNRNWRVENQTYFDGLTKQFPVK